MEIIIWIILSLLSIIIGFFASHLYRFAKYLYWSQSSDSIESLLYTAIYKIAGIINIKGGASTGKSQCLVLLMKYLRGKKWTNVTHAIPGVENEELNLKLLNQHQKGIFTKEIGKNHCLFIDRSWAFFSNNKLKESNLTKKELADMLEFFSQTSANGYKIFLVSKQNTNKLVDHFIDNRTAQIETLGIRKFVEWQGNKYYYLDIKLEDRKIAIPFDEKDFDLFDATASLDLSYSKNRMQSIVNRLDYDKLVEMVGIRQSREQKLREQAELSKNQKNVRSSKKRGPKKKKQVELPNSAGEGVGLEEMEEIYSLASQKYNRDTPQWEREVESLITIRIERGVEEDENF